MEDKNFDWNQFEKEALAKLKLGRSLEGRDGVLAPLIKRLLEASLEGELDAHLKESETNRRNGKTSKKLKTGFGTQKCFGEGVVLVQEQQLQTQLWL